ncbi:ATP-binding cassette domain-containing protein [Niameybacter massiliensis]|uniref:ABC transporter ATP-binding protein n=1 Tax=Holtiella tumoricola TaxID=3018743 RepID=A0AA42DLA9_9FIRM|nr:ATP-binding cassette domain-containing protein [Holtiella tumoricola]MDA3731152.1 ATP-binding cassette domain-containing protein [Holtiella tumoricola]
MNYIMETKNLSFQYPDGTHALDNICLHLEKGTTTGLLGGNGAGKSTLFLLLNGILKPTQGEVLYNNQPISYTSKGLQQLRQSVGIVFQDPDTQLFSASVYEDVSFGVVNLGISESEARVRIERALKQTGTYELRHKPTHSLSYGQKKRVALAGIIAMEPTVLILDEPTAGLDPQGVKEIMDLIDTLKQNLNMAIIIATHDMDLVPLYCDYLYVLKSGQLHTSGTVSDVFSQPHILETADLCLPYVGQLMYVLKEKDHLAFTNLPVTVQDARKTLLSLLK